MVPSVPSNPLILTEQTHSKTISEMAYGGLGNHDGGKLYRLERGTPYYRAGKVVYATPQFKGLTIYSPTSSNAQLPTSTPTNVSIVIPTKAK